MEQKIKNIASWLKYYCSESLHFHMLAMPMLSPAAAFAFEAISSIGVIS